MSKNSKIKPCQWTTKNKQILSLSVLLTGSGLNWGVRDRFSALIKLKQLSHCLDHSLIRFLGRGGWGTWFTQSEDPNMQKVTFFSSRFAFTILHMYIDQLEVTWRSNLPWPTLLLLCCQPGKHLRGSGQEATFSDTDASWLQVCEEFWRGRGEGGQRHLCLSQQRGSSQVSTECLCVQCINKTYHWAWVKWQQ